MKQETLDIFEVYKKNYLSDEIRDKESQSTSKIHISTSLLLIAFFFDEEIFRHYAKQVISAEDAKEVCLLIDQASVKLRTI